MPVRQYSINILVLHFSERIVYSGYPVLQDVQRVCSEFTMYLRQEEQDPGYEPVMSSTINFLLLNKEIARQQKQTIKRQITARQYSPPLSLSHSPFFFIPSSIHSINHIKCISRQLPSLTNAMTQRQICVLMLDKRII